MPKRKIKVVLDEKNVEKFLKDESLMEEIGDSVAPQLIGLFEKLYEGSKWEGMARSTPSRAAYVFKTDDPSVPFREAETGRIRKALRVNKRRGR